MARGLCTVVPGSLHVRVLAMAHEGQLDMVKRKQCSRARVWWLGIDREIEALVKDCSTCLVRGMTGHSPPPPLQPLAWPSRPWQHLQLDICSEIHRVPHNQCYLVVVYDLHSKWPELTATGSVTSQVIVDFLDSLFSCWGLPQLITTDNGPQFISGDFKSYLESKGIQHIRTALYHPQVIMVAWSGFISPLKMVSEHTWPKGVLSVRPFASPCCATGPLIIAPWVFPLLFSCWVGSSIYRLIGSAHLCP